MPDPGLLREAGDPATPGARLAEIAATEPELGATIAANPACYPALLDWLAQYGDSAAQAAVASRQAADDTPATSVAAVTSVTPSPIVDPFAPTTPAPSAAPAASLASAASAGTASPRTTRTKGAVIIAVAVVGSLVIGGGIAAAMFLPRVLPATSADGAVDKLIQGAISLDPLSLGGALAPSEVSALTSPLGRLGEIEIDPDQQQTAQEALERLTAAITVTADGLEYDTDEIAEGVERVSVTRGTIEIDGDEDDIADAYADLMRVYIVEQYEAMDMDTDDAEDAVDDMRDSIADQLDLPVELDFRDIEDELGFPFSLVAVHEGTGWYVSPLLSMADFYYQAAEASNYNDPGRLGDEVPDPVAAPDAAEAAAQTLTAALNTDAGRDYWEELAATLPLAERRLVAIYGPAFGDDPWEEWNDRDYELELARADFENVDGSHAVPDEVTVEWNLGYEDYEMTIDHSCVDWRREGSTYTDTFDGCLDDLPIDLDELGLDEPSLVAVREGGGWQISILDTLGEWSATAVDNLIRLSKDDDLDRLFR